MAVLIFWNTNGRDTGMAIGHLCREYDADIVLLAETETGSARLVTEVNRGCASDRAYWELPRRESRIRALTHYPPGMVRPLFDDGHVKMLELRPPIGLSLLIVAVHLPSKTWSGPEEQKYRVRRLRQDIEEQEVGLGHRNTVVIGDLNVNPFEDAVTAADGLHGVMDKSLARRPARVVQGQAWNYFYNPMWSRLGDESVGPPGTYWHSGTGLVNHFWNTFDQVLLRPDLLVCYDPAGLVIPKHAGDQVILREVDDRGLSDHLPVVLSLSIEEGARRG